MAERIGEGAERWTIIVCDVCGFERLIRRPGDSLLGHCAHGLGKTGDGEREVAVVPDAALAESNKRCGELEAGLSWALDVLEISLKRLETLGEPRPALADAGLAKARSALAQPINEGKRCPECGCERDKPRRRYGRNPSTTAKPEYEVITCLNPFHANEGKADD